MTESEYLIAVDDFLRRIEDAVDALGREDIELSPGDGKLSIDFEDGSKLILSRQRAVQQIWLAEPRGGWHYSAGSGGRWLCDKRGTDLVRDLETLVGARLGKPVKLE
ncbi:MAG: iron donor protein CyaY [Deltaproteobacteria bacterium]|nr:iron donor protein CyaY [Deltaproteobacteria bacterium]